MTPYIAKRLMSLSLLTVLGIVPLLAHADSFTFNGPGMRVQERKGWFGRHSESYDDALGNGIGSKQGLFHRTDRAGIFGNQAQVTQGPFGNRISVHGADGSPLVQSAHHWYGANNTTIDGNNILHSFRNMLPSASGNPNQAPTAPQGTP
jgi:hypothetical protein